MASSQPVWADQSTINYDITADNLNDALVKFASLSGLEVVFSTDLIRGIQSSPVKGQLTVEQALTAILKHTGFSYRFIDSDTITLQAAVNTQSTPQATDSSTLDTINVIGTQISQTYNFQHGTEVSDDTPQSYRASHAITATRTDTPVMQIPQSLQTIKRSLLDDQQNVTLTETLSNVSGLVPHQVLFTPVVESTLIRGFRAEQLLDGFTQYYGPGDRESTVNLERIEVLKGSNAVLYGGGSGSPAGGTINLVSKLPQAQAATEIGLKLGSYGFYQPYLDWNQPLSERTLFRLTGEYTAADSHVDVVHTERFNINPTLVFTTHNGTTLRLQGKLSRWRQPDYQGLPATGTITGNFRIPGDMFIGQMQMPSSHSNSEAIWVGLEQVIDSTWSLNVKAHYASSEFKEISQFLYGSDGFVADKPLFGSTWGLSNATLYQRQYQYSTLAYATAHFDWGSSQHTLLLGVDYSWLGDSGFLRIDTLDSANVDLQAPAFSYNFHQPVTALYDSEIINITYGGYFQLQSTLFERFHQLLSLRLGTVELGYSDEATGATANTRLFKPLPRVGGVFDLSDEISIFAGYGEGMRGQPYINFSSNPYPELSKQIEAGLKFDFSGLLSGQLAIYRIKRSHVAVNDPVNPLQYMPAGQQRSQGFEADVIWQPDAAIGILANYSYTQAVFLDALAGVPAGNRLAMLPKHAGRIWANYRFQHAGLQGLSMGMGVNLRSGAYLSNNNEFKTSGFYSFDAVLAYQTPQFKLAVTAKNFSGERYFLPYGYFNGHVVPAAGPSVYLTAALKF